MGYASQTLVAYRAGVTLGLKRTLPSGKGERAKTSASVASISSPGPSSEGVPGPTSVKSVSPFLLRLDDLGFLGWLVQVLLPNWQASKKYLWWRGTTQRRDRRHLACGTTQCEFQCPFCPQ